MRLRSGLLPAPHGHAHRGTSRPAIPEHAIEPFAEMVAQALRDSRANGCEHGFLAYAQEEPGAPLFAEPMSMGAESEIRWAWSHPHATVAFSFHTHPSSDALCAPSGIDAVGALIRGDHVIYVLTMDGRLSGWRFKEGKPHARAVDDAMLALDQARKLDTGFVQFLYDAFEALRPQVLKPVYAARLTLEGDGCRFDPAAIDAGFFSRAERS